MTPSPLIVAWWKRYSPDNDHDDEEILDDIVMMKLMLMRLQKCGNTHVFNYSWYCDPDEANADGLLMQPPNRG